VVSEDGHPVSGEITFELKTPSSVTVATPSATYKSESTNASQVNKSGNSLTLIAIVTGIFVGLGILLFVRYRSRKKSEN
jgi:formate/nitrite transporter FocA (FNT family)